jgi:3-hydroxyisobutyrate dehydrogenase-like beta-hydroxyacid dehydrogenase
MKIGFIGLGSMGKAMATVLVNAGNELTVYNRTRSSAEELARSRPQIKVADSPQAAAKDAEVVITMLSNDAAVEAVTVGQDSLSAGLAPDATHISMSSISPDLSTRLAKIHADAGRGYIAAPVFGRPDAAAQGNLWIVVGGDPAKIDRYRPILEAMSRGWSHVGTDPAQANLVKIAGNFAIAATIETLGESFALMQKSGIAPKDFLQILNEGVFRSPVYENYGTQIVEQKFEPARFALQLGLKDIRLVLQAADRVAVPMPLASLLHDRLLSAIARGYADNDWSGLARISAEDAGI